MTDETTKKLWLPALRGHMGDWTYYVTLMKMYDLASRVGIVEQAPYTSKALNEYSQPELGMSKHAGEIANYLLSQPQRFFSNLVIGVYGGAPRWYELSVQSNTMLNEEELLNDVEGVLGILILEGTENLFIVDGQHRLMGIRQAVQENSELGDEEVSAIFVAHREDLIGLERTRHLSSTLNRHAKPVER